jgi:hypothetical protein
LRQLGVNILGRLSPSIVNITALKLAGPALWLTPMVSPDYAGGIPARDRRHRQASIATCRQGRARQPEPWPYDRGYRARGQVINKACSTDATKIREAILATKKFPGAEGEYNFDLNGDGLHGYKYREERQGQHAVFDKHIEFNDWIRRSASPLVPAGEAQGFFCRAFFCRAFCRTVSLYRSRGHGSLSWLTALFYRHRHRRFAPCPAASASSF